MPTAEDVSTRSPRRALTVAGAGTMLTLVVFTAPLATLNATSASLGADIAGRTWILSSMSIGLGAALLSTGTIADDFGRRRTFVGGLLVLAAGSIGCALAPHVLVLVLARVLQGLGGAAVIASGLGIIAHVFPAGPARAAASGVWGASVGAGIAVGPCCRPGSIASPAGAGVTLFAVVAARPGTGSPTADLIVGWNSAAMLTAGISVVGAVVVLACRPRRP